MSELDEREKRFRDAVVGFGLLHFTFVIVGPIVGGMILLLSPFKAQTTAVLLLLTLALVLFAGLAAYYGTVSVRQSR